MAVPSTRISSGSSTASVSGRSVTRLASTCVTRRRCVTRVTRGSLPRRLRRGARGNVALVGVRTWIEGWPVYRQVVDGDPLGRGAAVKSAATQRIAPRTSTADTVVKSVCPYCAVGCGQNVYVRDGKVVQIEGDPDSPISRGRLCPKGSASKSLVTSDRRQQKVLYRRPYGTEWESLDLETAMDMIADRVLAAREETWQDTDHEQGTPVNRTLGISSLGGATLDNEENYLIKKLFTAIGAIQIENQARI